MDIECWAVYALTQETDIYVLNIMKWSGKCNYIFIPIDILRFTLFCVLFTEIPDYKIILYLHVPNLLFVIFAAFTDIYFICSYCVNKTRRKWNNNDHTFKLFCQISMFWIFLTIIGNALNILFQAILWFIFPYTTFQWRIIWIYPHYANRFFTDKDDTTSKQYIAAILQYSLNHNYGKNETLKRIIASNYYLITMFIEEIDECNIMDEYNSRFMDGSMFDNKTQQLLIEKIAGIHNQLIIDAQQNTLFRKEEDYNDKCEDNQRLEQLQWNEIGDGFEGFTGHCMIPVIFFLVYIICYTLQIISLYIYTITIHQINKGYLITFIIYVITELIYLPFNVKLYSLASYSCYLLPNVMNIKTLEWNDKFDVDTMIDEITSVYQIMFQTEIIPIYELDIQHDIAYIIAQYLFFELSMDSLKLEETISHFNALDQIDHV